MAQGKVTQSADNKGKSKSWIIYLTFLILLALSSYGSFQYGKMSAMKMGEANLPTGDGDEIVIEDEESDEDREDIEQEDEIEIDMDPEPVQKTKMVKRPKKSKKNVARKSGKYAIRVASCFFDPCKNNYINSLKRKGIASVERDKNKKVVYFELTSKETMKYDDAKLVIDEINRSNKMAGSASLKNSKNGFQITMGVFPERNFAEKLRTYIAGIPTTYKIDFSVKNVNRLFSETVVFAGPFPNKLKADNILSSLKKDRIFRDAFITTLQ